MPSRGLRESRFPLPSRTSSLPVRAIVPATILGEFHENVAILVGALLWRPAPRIVARAGVGAGGGSRGREDACVPPLLRGTFQVQDVRRQPPHRGEQPEPGPRLRG